MVQPNRLMVETHAFAIGNKVRLAAVSPLSNAKLGPYTIVGLLPEGEGAFQYRIKSDDEPFQRIVKEDQLKRR